MPFGTHLLISEPAAADAGIDGVNEGGQLDQVDCDIRQFRAQVPAHLTDTEQDGLDLAVDLESQLLVALAIRARRKTGHDVQRWKRGAVQVRTSSS